MHDTGCDEIAGSSMRLQEGLPAGAANPMRRRPRLWVSTEDDLLQRLAAMREAGVITRFGPFL